MKFVVRIAIFVLAVMMSVTVFADLYPIQVFKDGEVLEFENKPFVYGEAIYIPLREFSAKIGISEDENNKIIWDNGRVIIRKNFDCFEIAIGSNKIEHYVIDEAHTGDFDVTESDAPVLLNGTTYIPYQYIFHIYNRYDREFDIECVVGDVDLNEPYLDNAEGITYPDICYLQHNVDNGHLSWRLEPEQVIRMFASSKGLKGDGIISELAGGVSVCATYTENEISYAVEVFKPVQKDDWGVWVVKSFDEKLGLYDAEGKAVSKEANWYAVGDEVTARIPLGDKNPVNIAAYYAPAGTETADLTKQLGVIKSPFDDAAATMNLEFDKDTYGHLWFVTDYEDTSVVSDYYNVFYK